MPPEDQSETLAETADRMTSEVRPISEEARIDETLAVDPERIPKNTVQQGIIGIGQDKVDTALQGLIDQYGSELTSADTTWMSNARSRMAFAAATADVDALAGIRDEILARAERIRRDVSKTFRLTAVQLMFDIFFKMTQALLFVIP